MDVEDKEMSLEQTRKKYQNEFSNLTNELEIERENVIHARAENTHLRDELEELRSKWDDEVLNSSTWAKEKARLEMTLQDLSSSREEAVNAHNDAQSKIVSLLSQVRNLRTASDDLSAERDLLLKEKRGLETRLAEAGSRLEDLARGDSPSMRNAAGMDRELLDLRSQLAQKEDIAEAAVGKMRRAEALVLEMQKDVVAERETNVSLHREKATLEKSLKDLQGKVVELEAKGFSSASHDVRFLNGRVKEVHLSSRQICPRMLTSAPSWRNSSKNRSPPSLSPHDRLAILTVPCGTSRHKLTGGISKTRSSKMMFPSPEIKSSDYFPLLTNSNQTIRRINSQPVAQKGISGKSARRP